MLINNTIIKIIVLVMYIHPSSLFAQNMVNQERNAAIDSLICRSKNLTDNGYLTWNKDLMLQGFSLLQHAEKISHENKFVEYYLAFVGYRLMTFGMAMKDDKLYDDYVDQTEKRASDLCDMYEHWSEPKPLLASIYGIEIAHNWMKSFFIGSKSEKLANAALSIDSANPRAYLVMGINKLNTPSIIGGGTKEGIEYLSKSVTRFERERQIQDSLKDDLRPDWGYVDALTWLGIAYEKQQNYTGALAVYEKALQIYPNYTRAEYSLIPQLREKMAKADKR
jgi:tetratricopeptide (TPR) repeat protein